VLPENSANLWLQTLILLGPAAQTTLLEGSVVPQVRRLEPEKWQRLLEGLWLSGLRISEALALSWDQDADIAVWLTGKYPKLRIWGEAQKSGQDQLLPITPDFAESLLAVPVEQRSGLVFGIEGPNPGQPLSTKRASRYISAIGEKAGVVVNKADGKYGSAHDLTRAFGTRWSKKVMPATLQLLMRHKSIETTLKYYVEQDADDVVADLWAQHAAQGNISGNTTGSPVKVAPDPTRHPNRKPLAQQGVA
jgi:integrase